ncbi:MAG: hypothetical protein MI807_13105 [Verrucomicrobiales bacterium]|nr:hypothetical protein [Verrucomicrobiales bacterium]
MKISELREILKDLETEHGDIDVNVQSSTFDRPIGDCIFAEKGTIPGHYGTGGEGITQDRIVICPATN